ncbi:hypothetical protein VIGAN_04152200, partial [Vigna angularis var. angularis]
KREYIFRHKSFHVEKGYRTYGSKGSLRGGRLNGLNGLILDKKLKSVSESTTINLKSASLNISKASRTHQSQDCLQLNNLAEPCDRSIPGALNAIAARSYPQAHLAYLCPPQSFPSAFQRCPLYPILYGHDLWTLAFSRSPSMSSSSAATITTRYPASEVDRIRFLEVLKVAAVVLEKKGYAWAAAAEDFRHRR